MYQKYYKDFLEGHKNKIHLAAHSHHFWPDSAKKGHLEAYERAQMMSDKKWDYNFEVLIPDVQNIISKHLNFSRPQDIAFAPNTHELITKLLSAHFFEKKIKILTSTHEFHSVSRQLKRLQEEDIFEIDYVDVTSPDDIEDLLSHLSSQTYDFIFISHVFYDSGMVLSEKSIKAIIENKKSAHFILDGYHHYCAIPFDISPYEDQLFYLSGGYKYAQSGEGMCFMTLPKACDVRPSITGWFADFNALENPSKKVNYSNDGMRFWGSTIDLTPFYRFRAVWREFEEKQITISDFHTYIRDLQEIFIDKNPLFSDHKVELPNCGHFLCYSFKNTDLVKSAHQLLEQNSIMTDFRGTTLRFGFAPYLVAEDIEKVKVLLNSLEFK